MEAPSTSTGSPPTQSEITRTIEAAISRPTAIQVDVREFGAVGDGLSDDLPAFHRAIERCSKLNGGIVSVPGPAVYLLKGPLQLKSNVWVELVGMPTLEFDDDPVHYPSVLTCFEGQFCYNYSPPVHADGQRNIGIVGRGVLDGRGQHMLAGSKRMEFDERDSVHMWAKWFREQMPDRDRLNQLSDDGVPLRERQFGRENNSKLRPNMVEFLECDGVILEGITVSNSSMWSIQPILSKNVLIRNCIVRSWGYNTDGVDPNCSENVLVEGCTFYTGDDAIAVKAMRNRDGFGELEWRDGSKRRMPPTRNIIFRRCEVGAVPGAENAHGLGGVAIGSEISAGVDNVYFEDVIISYRMRGIYCKTNTKRGGFIRNFHVHNISLRYIATDSLRISMDYAPSWAKDGEEGDKRPVFSDWIYSKVKVYNSGTGMHITRSAGGTLANIQWVDMDFVGIDNMLVIKEDAVDLMSEETTVEALKGVKSEGVTRFERLEIQNKGEGIHTIQAGG